MAKDNGDGWLDPCMIRTHDYMVMLDAGGPGMMARGGEEGGGSPPPTEPTLDPLRYLQWMIDTVQMHDNHEPCPHGRPQRWQNCAKVEPRTAGTDQEVLLLLY